MKLAKRYARHLRQRPQLCRRPASAAASDGSSTSIVGAALRVVLEVEIGRDRLDLGAAQIHRIEIEPQPVQQRQARRDDAKRDDDDRDAVARQKTVDRRQRRRSRAAPARPAA